MTNWLTLLIVGAVIIVGIFFVLPALGGSQSGKDNANIGGGIPTIPTGDLGTGGLPASKPIYETKTEYVPYNASSTSFQANETPVSSSFNVGGSVNNSGWGKTVMSSDVYSQVKNVSGGAEPPSLFGYTVKNVASAGSGKSTTHTLENQNYSSQGGGNYSGNVSVARGSVWHGSQSGFSS